MASKPRSQRPAAVSPVTMISSPAVAGSLPAPTPVLSSGAITLKDLQDALKDSSDHYTKGLKDIEKKMENLFETKVQGMADLLDSRNQEMKMDIAQAIEGLATHVTMIDECLGEVVDKQIKMDSRVGEVEEKVERLDTDVIMNQYRSMEFALRIRGLKEDPKENLYVRFAHDVAPVLEWPLEDLIKEMDKAFRINSWVARQRKLPRDIVIYFSKRSIRNDIIQAFYNKQFQIDGQDVIILKEIPPKILRKRKEFAFLANELKNQQINFRWEIPVGMVVNFNGMKHRLTTVLKAKDFYYNVLKIDSMPLPPQKEDQFKQAQARSQESLVEELSLSSEEVRQITQKSTEEVKEQRMTRAAHRRQEKEEKSKKTYAEAAEAGISTSAISPAISAFVTHTSEAVGGARMKVREDVQASLGKLRATKDGGKVSDLEC